MSEKNVPNIPTQKKRKVKIKFRKRVKITERPKGYKLKRFWRKNNKNIMITTILSSILIVSLIMAARVITKSMEENQQRKQEQYELLYQ